MAGIKPKMGHARARTQHSRRAQGQVYYNHERSFNQANGDRFELRHRWDGQHPYEAREPTLCQNCQCQPGAHHGLHQACLAPGCTCEHLDLGQV